MTPLVKTASHISEKQDVAVVEDFALGDKPSPPKVEQPHLQIDNRILLVVLLIKHWYPALFNFGDNFFGVVHSCFD